MDSEQGLDVPSYLHRQMADHPPRLRFSASTPGAWRVWRTELRRKLYDLLAPWPAPVELAPEVLGVYDEGDHWREEVVLNTHENMRVPGTLLAPKDAGQPRPAILALHGHGRGKDEIVGTVPSRIYAAYGRQMVRAGYVVFAFDFIPFGAREEEDAYAKDGDACSFTLARTLLWGYNLLTLNLFDALCALDYLQTRAEVDAERMGVIGCSYGGTTSMYTAVLDERVKAAVLSCSLGEYVGHGVDLDERNGICGSQVVPGILQWAEMGDVAGLIAPRPLLVESALGDTCFPWSYTEATVQRVREVYRVAGAEGALEIRIHDGDHRYYGDGVVEFWQRYL